MQRTGSGNQLRGTSSEEPAQRTCFENPLREPENLLRELAQRRCSVKLLREAAQGTCSEEHAQGNSQGTG